MLLAGAQSYTRSFKQQVSEGDTNNQVAYQFLQLTIRCLPTYLPPPGGNPVQELMGSTSLKPQSQQRSVSSQCSDKHSK